MARRSRGSSRGEDAVPWIAYTDFLISLSALLLVVVIALGTTAPGTGVALVQVVSAATGAPVADCPIVVRSAVLSTTDGGGQAVIRVDSLAGKTRIEAQFECRGFDPRWEVLTLVPGDTLRQTVRLAATGLQLIRRLPGDALFAQGSAELTPAGIRQILDALAGYGLGPSDMLRVGGHTDDQRFDSLSTKDNWKLSGERAAAAARILLDSLHIDPCQVVIEGFGPYRPRDPIDWGRDPEPVRRRKRATNRRIEFVRVSSDGKEIEACRRAQR